MAQSFKSDHEAAQKQEHRCLELLSEPADATQTHRFPAETRKALRVVLEEGEQKTKASGGAGAAECQ